MPRNIAKVKQVVDHTECEECDHNFMFLMKDNHHTFFVPVDELFVAMQLASNKGIIPPIPNDWLFAMGDAHYTIIDDA